MFIAQKLDPALEVARPNDEGSGFAPVLGLLLFLWLLLGALLTVVAFAPHRDGAAVVDHQFEDLLPAAPQLWSGFAA